MSEKNYGDIRHIAMGHISHEEMANALLNLHAGSPELLSVARGGADRILHLIHDSVESTDFSEVETLRRQLEDANTRNTEFSAELTQALMNVANEKLRADELQGEVNALNTKLAHIEETYDMSDEGDDDSADAENEQTGDPIPQGYIPTRAEIKEIALANGFQLRTPKSGEGEPDLSEYVYVTVEKVVDYAISKS